MNEAEALKYAANLLRTFAKELDGYCTLSNPFLLSARRLDSEISRMECTYTVFDANGDAVSPSGLTREDAHDWKNEAEKDENDYLSLAHPLQVRTDE